jgi:hypothetical protein
LALLCKREGLEKINTSDEKFHDPGQIKKVDQNGTDHFG